MANVANTQGAAETPNQGKEKAQPWRHYGAIRGEKRKGPTKALRQLFLAKRFGQVISGAKKHLRQAPSDREAWHLLAASYYHVGDFQQAARVLKAIRRGSKNPAYIDLYLGLSQLRSHQPQQARMSLAAAGRRDNAYASYALYELALLEAAEQRWEQAANALAEYRRRFPLGQQRELVRRLQVKVDRREDIQDLSESGIVPIDRGGALYREHPYSLTAIPHFWLATLGTQMTTYQTKYPVFDGSGSGALADLQTSQQSLVADIGFGLGPVLRSKNKAVTGYFYRSLWHTTEERLDNFQDDYGDLDYFPFRPDLMERRHVLFADLQRELPWDNQVGVYGRLEFGRIGSKLFPGPEDTQINRSLSTRDITLVVPHWNLRLHPQFDVGAYLYFLKLINSDEPDFSQKSYATGDDPALSFGLTAAYTYSPWRLRSDLSVYQHEAIFNDYWQDHVERGFRLSGTGDLPYGLNWMLGWEWMQRQYILPIPRIGSCSGGSGEDFIPGAVPRSCDRASSGMAWRWGLGYRLTDQMQFQFAYKTRNHRNPNQPEYDWQYSEIHLGVTIGFPQPEHASRYLNHMMPPDEVLLLD